MKKIKILFLVFILFFILKTNVNAYDCHYKANQGYSSFGDKIIEGHFSIDNNKISTYSFVNYGAPKVIDYYADSKYTDEYIINNVLKGNCPSQVYMCIGTTFEGEDYSDIPFILVNASLHGNLKTDKKGLVHIEDYWFNPKDNCYVGYYDDEKSTAPDLKLDLECEAYINLYSELQKSYCVSGTLGCSVDKKKNYNQAKDKLRNYCSTILQYSDFINPCIDKCLNLKNEIAELEGTTPELGECGFSDKLVGFILNIIKWIKYIIPAIVIILSIIDFIKAMAGDKDDEMKKAQGKFIKRLIAAALIFIVPLILEFILDKMGFAEHIKGCGIIDF